MKNIKNGDYCGLSGFLTGMIFDEENKDQTPVIVEQPKAVNITININLNKDEKFSYKDLIKSIVDGLS